MSDEPGIDQPVWAWVNWLWRQSVSPRVRAVTHQRTGVLIGDALTPMIEDVLAPEVTRRTGAPEIDAQDALWRAVRNTDPYNRETMVALIERAIESLEGS